MDVCTGLFKVASGEDITKAEQPGTFDLKVCFHWNSHL